MNRRAQQQAMREGAAQQRYAAAWRWHFFAGVIVIPFLLVLATTGLIMLYYSSVQTPLGERL
ncbi:MAG TPA: PepSY domain-containing protein, partial [Halioglobus sp.]